MKLRLEGNSIRFRVRKSDLVALLENGAITETLLFPNNLFFNYQLTVNQEEKEVNALFSNDTVTVALPLSKATAWIHSEEVGIEQTLSSGLFILIEKDFPCKDRPWEDTNDTFFELVDQNTAQC